MISPDQAIALITDRVGPVAAEHVGIQDAAGRVLRQSIKSDRPSPSADVSAMDGYAVRSGEIRAGELPVVGEVRVGSPPPSIDATGAVRIMTGGAVPPGFDAVIRREDVTEEADSIVVDQACASAIRRGQCIRREGENLPSGEIVVDRPARISPSIAGALASFGIQEPLVSCRVRIAYLSTGDELVPLGAPVTPYQIRDSSRLAIQAFARTRPWCEVVADEHAADDLDATARAVSDLLGRCDLLITTGGVSAGDRDFVPAAVRQAGGEVLFHRVAQRPGKPLLGAVGTNGQVILGLPGNPVSVLVALRRIVEPILNHLAGCTDSVGDAAALTLDRGPDRTLDLWHFPLVRRIPPHSATLIDSRGSGDLVSASRSDGFVEIPPGESGTGPWRFVPWDH